MKNTIRFSLVIFVVSVAINLLSQLNIITGDIGYILFATSMSILGFLVIRGLFLYIYNEAKRNGGW